MNEHMPNLVPVDFDPFSGGHDIEKLAFTNEPQKEIWLSCAVGGDDANRAYNESLSLKVNGNLDIDALRTAVKSLVLRHEALRATISPDGESLIVYEDGVVDIIVEDLSGLSAEERDNRFNDFLKVQVDTVLDIKDGPLFKVFVHKAAESEYYITIIKHHIIADGWSSGLILEDISKLYNAYVKGEEVSLSPAYQLSDYATAHENFRQTAAYKETEKYWLDLYVDDVPVLDLPADNPRRSPRSYKGNRIDQAISKEMVDRLKTLGAKAGASLVTTFLAAFEVFLYKETHQRDLVVGLPSSGQAASGLTDVVGHCVNLLPLRTRIEPETSFSDYLKKRKKEVLDAYDHQRITFGELINKLHIQRDPARIPLAPVMFNIDMGMDNSVSFEGLTHKLISNPRTYENFEIFLNATGTESCMILEWSYNTGLFNASTINRFNSEYHSILEKIIANPDVTITDLADESGSDSVAYGNDVAVPLNQTVNSLLAEAVKQYANKTAVSFGDVSLTYEQLDQKVAQLSAYLLECGIKKGDIVALSIDRSVEMLVSLLAVLRAGAVYLPLDPEYPGERIEFMLNDSSAKLLLTSENYKNRYQTNTKQIVIEEVWPTLNNTTNVSLPEVNGNDLAYLLYTSGSTGKPKGVMIMHLNLANFLLSMKASPGINSNDKLLAVTSMSFDIAGLELYLPLISGAELVLASTDATRDGRMLLDIIAQKNVTIMQATPSSWQMMLDSGWEKKYDLKVLSGGEALPLALANKLIELGAELWNMYGPTETTIWSTIKQILPEDKQVTIGQPINNTQVYILDETGKPLPFNQVGEICIGGIGVAAGYFNREELTAEKFVTDRFAKAADARLYKTGDLGKMLESGEILCLGRIDHQVKVRGHRIELGEIETKVQELEGVKQCVVVAREDVPGNKRLISYVTLNESTSDTPGWKDHWDTIYQIGAEDKKDSTSNENIDGTLLEHHADSEELTKQAAEWLKVSVDRIKELGAKNIYEIGSGAGQVLFELAPGVESYLATDYAQAAIDNINKRLTAESGQWAHVKASAAPADDFSAVGNMNVDLVLINSVAQYFPNADYLVNVVKQAVKAMTGSGCVFIGDMQGKNTLEMYHAMDHLSRASDLTTVGSFKEVVENRVRIEEELVADPAFFYLLPKLIPGITGVDVQLRRGQSLNETTKYHYDVWLYVGKQVQTVSAQTSLDWNELGDIAQLDQVLTAAENNVIEIKNILNARTAQDHKLQQLLNSAPSANVIAGIKDEVLQVNEGLHPDLFWELGEKMNCRTHIRWTTDGTDSLFDVVFIKSDDELTIPASPLEIKGDINSYARAPLSIHDIKIAGDRLNNWQEELKGVLPVYMVPDDFVVLNKIPLTPNGKIDRKALPAPPQKKGADKSGQRPLTANEQLVADVWADTLGLEGLTATDDFFQLGGHSLLAVKVMVTLEKKTGKRLTIATLFEHSTIEKLARQLAGDETSKDWEVLVPIKTTGSKTPLFYVHGAELNVGQFKSINEYFDEDQPIYGLQALGLNYETDIPETMEQIAARYIAEMIKVHPDGPYAIAGYSLGGFFAFEIARLLQQMGKKVSFVGIIDTYAGIYKQKSGLIKIKRKVQKAAFLTRSLVGNTKEALDYQLSVVRQKLDKMVQPDSGSSSAKGKVLTGYEHEIYQKYSSAKGRYQLTSADIKVHLFVVEKRLYFVDDLISLGWKDFALKGVTAHRVPGEHGTVLYHPNSQRFARILQGVLNSECQK